MSSTEEDLRKFCADTNQSVRERWLTLKNLCQRINLEDNPPPLWERLKTQIVREAVTGECFQFRRARLNTDTQAVTKGLRWSQTSATDASEIWTEDLWLRFGERQPRDILQDEVLKGFENWDKPDLVARQQVLQGIPWSVNLTIQCAENRDIFFYLPLDVGYMHDPEGKVEREWLRLLKEEARQLQRSLKTQEVTDMVAQIHRVFPDANPAWLRVLMPEVIRSQRSVERLSQVMDIPSPNRDTMYRHLSTAARHYRDDIRWGVADPTDSLWGGEGLARTYLCEFALRQFWERDTGRTILVDYLRRQDASPAL